MRMLVLTLAFVSVAACAVGASSAGNLRMASARAITPTPLPDSVAVSEIRRGTTVVRWVATTSSGVYDCQADDMLKKPAVCVKRSSPSE